MRCPLSGINGIPVVHYVQVMDTLLDIISSVPHYPDFWGLFLNQDILNVFVICQR